MKTNVLFVILIWVGLNACHQPDQTIASENSQTELVEVSDQKEQPEIRIIEVTDHPEELTSDAFRVVEAQIDGDILSITVSYGGGCRDHNWKMLTSGVYAKSYPPKLNLFLKHEANQDMCKALLRETLKFELKNIQYLGSEILHLQLNNYDEFIVYNY